MILRGRITIPDQDKLTGEKTVVVKVNGFGTPIALVAAPANHWPAQGISCPPFTSMTCPMM